MDYDRLARPGSTESLPAVKQTAEASPPRRRRLLLLAVTATLLLVVSAAASIALFASHRHRSRTYSSLPKPSEAISQTCSLTLYPSLCITSLVEIPGATLANRLQLVPLAVNMTTHRVTHAASAASSLTAVSMDRRLRSAYDACMELLSDSVHHLSRSLAGISPATGAGDGVGTPSADDVLTWLSAALTSHDTCADGLEGVDGGYVKDQLNSHFKDLAELVSNSLAIVSSSTRNGEFIVGVPKQRRKLMSAPTTNRDGFPSWLGRRERWLLQAPASAVHADFIVSKDGGNGTYRTISDAVKAAPEKSQTRIVIYVKAGRYYENVKVARKKTNLMFIGDGNGKTVVVGSRSVTDHFTTFHTATFAATGAGFIARDMSFENWAGPEKHQAVALRIGADHSVVYRCSISGYQDSLYVHSLRQFYRECYIFGTVDFIFGNAAVVLQNCTIYARKPLPGQTNTITAQGRKDPNQNTGISIHDSQLLPTDELVSSGIRTYLGRPWKLYSRTVYMQSYIGGHVDPAGWLEWNGNYALDTLYYGEYMNYGPGAGMGKRVKWAGYRVITLEEEASKFTVGGFIGGTSWLPSTGVAFLAGLSRS